MKKRVTNENQSRKFDRVMKDIDDKKNERKERLLVNQNLGVNVRRTIAAETTDCILNLKKELLGPLVKAIGGKMTEDEFKEEYSKFFKALAPNQQLIKQLEELCVGDLKGSEEKYPLKIGRSFVKAFQAEIGNAIGKPFKAGVRGSKRYGKSSYPHLSMNKS